MLPTNSCTVPFELASFTYTVVNMGALVGSPDNYSVPLPTNCLVCPASPYLITVLCWSCPAYSRPIPTYSHLGTWILRHLGYLTLIIRVLLHDFRVNRADARLIPTSAPMPRGPYGTPSGYSAFLPAIYHVCPLNTPFLRTLAGLDGSTTVYHQHHAVSYGEIGMAVGLIGQPPINSIHLPLPPGMVKSTTDDGWWSAKPNIQSSLYSVRQWTFLVDLIGCLPIRISYVPCQLVKYVTHVDKPDYIATIGRFRLIISSIRT